MQRYSVTTFTTRAIASTEKQVAGRREQPVPALTAVEEAVLSGITTSGEFTLEKAANMYAGVRRLRPQK